VFRNDVGFTLIEFLVSIVILMVGLLGLLQAVNVSYSHSLQNQLRNEAVIVADDEMAKELAKGFEGVAPVIVPGVPTPPVLRNYTVSRKILSGFKLYSVSRTGSVLDTQNTKQVTLEVRWNYKGVRYTHNASGALSKTNQ